MQHRDLLSVADVALRYPALPVRSLRYFLYHRNRNGLARAVIRVGRRVFIDGEAFEQWIEGQREGSA